MRLSRRLAFGPFALIALALLAAGARQQAPQAPIFEVDPLWPRPLPNHWLLGQVNGIAVDARDHVLIVHRNDFGVPGAAFNARTEVGAATNPPTGECCLPAPNVLEFDPTGVLVRHWGGPGEGFSWPAVNHGIALDPQGNVWIGGSGGTDTFILKFSREGRFLGQIGKTVSPPPAPAVAAPDTTAVSGRAGRGGRGGAAAPPALPPNSASHESFGGPAAFSFDAATNEAFVADGYRNRRVVVVAARTGAIQRFFGAFGNLPADANPAPAQQFGTPVTCAELARDGLLYVCDRSNNRLQVFRKDGSFLREKVVAPDTRGAGSVWDVAFSADPRQRFLYVADGMNMKVHILDRRSLDVLASFGDGGRQPGQFLAVHSIATDSKGNIYTTETLEGKRVQKFIFKGVGPVTRANRGVVWPGRRPENRP